MNYKKLKEWNSGFVHWVIRRHPQNPKQQNGFMGGFIFGERGEGKSTYCYKAQAKTYYVLNGYTKKDNEEEAYKEALKYIIYEPTEFRKLLIYNKIKRIITPILCLDDASMHFGKMMYMINPQLYSALLGETATIRTAATGFLINAPRRNHVAKFLRDYDDFKGEVKIDKGGGNTGVAMPTWDRKVRFYRWNYYPDEVKYRIQIPFQDKYSCYIPEPYYTWYIEKKRHYELKHEMEVADRIDKYAREVFIEHRKLLPKEFQPMIDKWIKEAEELLEKEKTKEIESKLEKASKKMRMVKLTEKLKKFQDEKEVE